MNPPGTLRGGKKTGTWPFWVLLAAWCCANTPQQFTFGLMVWGGGARHFSHDQRLKDEVALLMGGKAAPAVYHAAPSGPVAPALPAVPTDSPFRRFDLYASSSQEGLSLAEEGVTFPTDDGPESGRSRSQPLLGPPRGQGGT